MMERAVQDMVSMSVFKAVASRSAATMGWGLVQGLTDAESVTEMVHHAHM